MLRPISRSTVFVHDTKALSLWTHVIPLVLVRVSEYHELIFHQLVLRTLVLHFSLSSHSPISTPRSSNCWWSVTADSATYPSFLSWISYRYQVSWRLLVLCRACLPITSQAEVLRHPNTLDSLLVLSNVSLWLRHLYLTIPRFCRLRCPPRPWLRERLYSIS